MPRLLVSLSCPIVRACPTCRALKGQPCRTVRGPVRLILGYHNARVAKARAAASRGTSADASDHVGPDVLQPRGRGARPRQAAP